MLIKQNNKGFTLIEIAIVLVIIGLLVGGAVPLMNVLSERKTRNESLDYLNEARAALVNFAKINGRLPWADTNNDGVSDAGALGWLPFQTLGIKPADSNSRRLRYALNSNLGTNLETSCRFLRSGLVGGPLVVDSDGTAAAFQVAAVLVSAGPRDADNDGNALDDVTAGTHQGDNTDGNPNYIRSRPTDTFDDLVVYLDRFTLYGEICGNPQVGITNSTVASVYVYNRTTLADAGIVGPNATVSFGIGSGSQIEIRSAAGGGGVIVLSTPRTDPPANTLYVAGSGMAITVP
jgi:prepilin-type N-terminal cleavage/methylation domain-containing protein